MLYNRVFYKTKQTYDMQQKDLKDGVPIAIL